MKYLPAFIIIILLLMFPQKAYCDEISISFLEYNDIGNYSWKSQNCHIDDGSNIFERVDYVLEYLFNGEYSGNVHIYPEDISILSLHYAKGLLTLDLSNQFNNFGGGSLLEQIYLGQIVKNLLDLPGVEKITIMVEGVCGNTPEGIIVKEKTSWQGVITDF